MAPLNLGDGSGIGILSGITNYLEAGGNPVRLMVAMVLGTGASIYVGIAKTIEGFFAFFSEPLFGAAGGLSELAEIIYSAPAGVIEEGEAVTRSVVVQYLGESIAGLLALPITVGIGGLSLLVVIWYLQEPETGEILPGLPIDVPNFFGLKIGVEEEDEDQDEEGFN